ncbi:MAG: TetR/AcrR family transcriptional regulator [Deltaproteobacteria bacterium]|nr:TetR/AcrR family transcriptional regulator [Deltaproteobacteria bacterium]
MAQKTDTRSSILQATLELIAEKGFHGSPTSMIADRAGISVGTIYCHFKTKDELIHALHEELEGKRRTVILKGYSEDLPFGERYFHLCRNTYHYLMENPLEFRFMEQYSYSPYGVCNLRQKLDSYVEPFHALFKLGIEQQIIKKLPLMLLFDLTFGPMINAIMDHNLGLLTLEEALIEEAIGATWDAVRR